MSQPDLLAEIRAARPVAPAELRGRVRELAATAPAPRRRLSLSFSWRRAVLVAVPVAAALVVAGLVVQQRGDGQKAAARESGSDVLATFSPGGVTDQAAPAPALKAAAHAASSGAAAAASPPANASRAQKYSATLTLRLPTAKAVSDATNEALAIAAGLGGYPLSVNVDAARRDGEAYLTLRVPRGRVQVAVRKLGALGTIVAENFEVQDVQAGIDTTGRRIARLQRKLIALRAQPQTEETAKTVAALEKQLERLRLQRAATLRATKYATVRLRMETPAPAAAEHHENGPLHGLGVAFHWLWVGGVYALALAGPLLLVALLVWLLVRGVRRRREEALLSRA